MKSCYYCNHPISDNQIICPMCGMENPDENHQQDITIEKQQYKINSTPVSRKEDKLFGLKNNFLHVIHHLTYLSTKISQPQSHMDENQIPSIFGYLTIAFASLLSAGTLTRVIGAWDSTYQLFSSISILPVMNVTFNGIEWLLKLTIFFFISAFLLALMAFSFARNKTEYPLLFNSWLIHFSGMNAFSLILLFISFILAIIAPLGLGIPALLVVAIHQLNYLVNFLLSLKGDNEDKVYYQGFATISSHFLLMSAILYLLIKI